MLFRFHRPDAACARPPMSVLPIFSPLTPILFFDIFAFIVFRYCSFFDPLFSIAADGIRFFDAAAGGDATRF